MRPAQSFDILSYSEMDGDPHAPQSITVMLRRWSTGDSSALDQLTPLVYAEFHGLADAYMRGESHAPTLQPTALIHEGLGVSMEVYTISDRQQKLEAVNSLESLVAPKPKRKLSA